MNPTIKLIAAFAVGFAIPAMAASDQSWYAAHALKAKPCALMNKHPIGAAYPIPGDPHKATKACTTD